MLNHMLIEEYCNALAKNGVDSLQTRAIRDSNTRNPEFVAFADSIDKVKKTFASRNEAICVDLDGTLLYYTNWKGMGGRLGKPRPGAREFLVNIRKFARVIIFTARLAEENMSNETLDQIELWLKHHNLPYDEIYIGKGKPIAEAFVDDRAIYIPKNPVESDFDIALIKMKRFMETY